MPDPTKPTSPTPTRTQLATAPTVLISPGSSSGGTGGGSPRRALAPRTRLQRFFSPDNLRDVVKTLAIVVPVTLLIWAWAEREQVQEKNFTVRLVPITSTDQAARIQDPTVEITLAGPNSGLDAFGRRLREENAEIAVRAPRVDPNSPKEEEASVNIAELLADQRSIRDAGLTVKSSTQVKFVIDQMRERSIEVQAPPDLNLFVAIEPATVMLRGPREALSRVPADARAILDLSPQELRRDLTTPGAKKVFTDVPIKLSFVPDRSSVQLLQTTVKSATLSVPVALEDRATINYFVSPRFDISADLINKRSREGKPPIVVTGTLQGIVVVGPRDVVAKVDSAEFKSQVFARIPVSRDNLLDLDAGKTIDVTPEILLPPGVRVDGPVPTLKLSAPATGVSEAN